LHQIPIRREFKYLLPPAMLPELRAQLAGRCTRDPHAGADGTYLLRSLYLDTASLSLYRANEREDAARFKARIRTYPEAPNSPVFAEIKGRQGDVIRKTRAVLTAHSWRDAIAGRLAGPATAALSAFVIRYHRHHLLPMTLVQYRREAFVSQHDVYARVSIDSEIVCSRANTLSLEPQLGWQPVDNAVRSSTKGSICVLELKWAELAPAWMIALVRRLELLRHSFSKYCYSMLTHAEDHHGSARRTTAAWA
jgi:hypothetical protein